MAALKRAGAAFAVYGLLLASLMAAAKPVAAATNLDVTIYDATSCSGTAYGITHEYNDLGSIGWNDRAGAIRAYSDSLAGHLYRDQTYTGESLAFSSGGSNCDLSDDFMAYWFGQSLYWNDQATSIGHN